MSKIALTPNPAGTGTLTIAAPSTNVDRTITLPDASGTILASGAPAASVDNVVTTKVPVVIGGTTYWLLASTSGG